jgi:hypothetical protein
MIWLKNGRNDHKINLLNNCFFTILVIKLDFELTLYVNLVGLELMIYQFIVFSLTRVGLELMIYQFIVFSLGGAGTHDLPHLR